MYFITTNALVSGHVKRKEGRRKGYGLVGLEYYCDAGLDDNGTVFILLQVRCILTACYGEGFCSQ